MGESHYMLLLPPSLYFSPSESPLELAASTSGLSQGALTLHRPGLMHRSSHVNIRQSDSPKALLLVMVLFWKTTHYIYLVWLNFYTCGIHKFINHTMLPNRNLRKCSHSSFLCLQILVKQLGKGQTVWSRCLSNHPSTTSYSLSVLEWAYVRESATLSTVMTELTSHPVLLLPGLDM